MEKGQKEAEKDETMKERAKRNVEQVGEILVEHVPMDKHKIPRLVTMAGRDGCDEGTGRQGWFVSSIHWSIPAPLKQAADNLLHETVPVNVFRSFMAWRHSVFLFHDMKDRPVGVRCDVDHGTKRSQGKSCHLSDGN